MHDVLVQPLINILVAIYAVIPGQDFGVAIIIFTILVRIALWPFVKKQFRQQRALRELQPEIAKIKSKTKGDKQKEAMLVMELYREREINPFASLGLILIQFPILIALFFAIRAVLEDGRIIEESYSFVRNLGYMSELMKDPSSFHPSLLGVIDLAKPSVLLAATAGIAQFAQTKQLMPKAKEKKKLSEILKKTAETGDNSEMMQAMNQSMGSFFSVLMFVISLTLPAALALYWTTGSALAVLQQRFILKKDASEAEEKVEEKIIEGEVIEKPKRQAKKKSSKKKPAKGKTAKRKK